MASLEEHVKSTESDNNLQRAANIIAAEDTEDGWHPRWARERRNITISHEITSTGARWREMNVPYKSTAIKASLTVCQDGPIQR